MAASASKENPPEDDLGGLKRIPMSLDQTDWPTPVSCLTLASIEKKRSLSSPSKTAAQSASCSSRMNETTATRPSGVVGTVLASRSRAARYASAVASARRRSFAGHLLPPAASTASIASQSRRSASRQAWMAAKAGSTGEPSPPCAATDVAVATAAALTIKFIATLLLTDTAPSCGAVPSVRGRTSDRLLVMGML
jgi:hypothetical protein